LLVCLSTNNLALKALREKGLNNRAKELERTTMLENLSWVNAFRKEFKFCEVYFFYSTYSEQVKNRDLSKIEFLGDDLKTTEFRPPVGTKFYVGDITNINTEGSNVSFEALIIKDSNFHQLKRPFPFYVRTFKSLAFLKRRPHKVVRKLNWKLRDYYNEKWN